MSYLVKRILAVVLLILPFASLGIVGFAFITSPQHSQSDPAWLAVAPISQIPIDGHPVRLPIVTARYDAWSRLSEEIVGHVYARLDLATNKFKVLSAVHGRLSVPVDYDRSLGCFSSRCFVVRFNIDGTVIPDQNIKQSQYEGMRALPAQIIADVLFVPNFKQ